MDHRAVREPQVGDAAAALGWDLKENAAEDLLRLKKVFFMLNENLVR